MDVHSQDYRQIHAALNRWDRYLRFVQSIEWLPRGLAAGLTVAFGVAVAARLRPLFDQEELIRATLLLAGLGVALTLVAVWLWRRSLLARAHRFDEVFHLKERMSAAVELAEGHLNTNQALKSAQHTDAVQTIESVHILRDLRPHLDWRDWALAGIAAGLTVAALVLPNPQHVKLAQQEAIDQAVAEQLVALEQARDEIENDTSLTEAERAEVTRALDEAIETLSQPGVTQEEAVAALDAAEQELRDLSEEFAEDRENALQQASGRFSEAGLDDVAEALQNGDFADAGEALSEALEGMTAEEQQALAEQLEDIASELAESNPDVSEALSEAAEALESGDTAAAQEALEEAGEELAQGGEDGGQAAANAASKAQKGQSEVAEAGGDTAEGDQASQPGQGGMGQAQPNEPGTGSGEGEGLPGAGSSAGRGEDEGAAPGSPAGSSVGSNDPGDGGETPYDDIYVPQRIGGEGGDQVDVPGSPDSGLPASEGEFVENPSGESSVDYSDVYGDYVGQVNEALESGYVPLGMRDLIQSYFSRLNPEQ